MKLITALLWVLAALAVAAGLLSSWASSCCGSSDPQDPTYAIVGLVVGCCLAGAALGLVNGMARPLVLLLVAAAPVACVVAGTRSSDLSVLALPAVVGWIALAVVVVRRRSGRQPE